MGFFYLYLFWITDFFENMNIAVAFSLPQKMHAHTRLHAIQGSWTPCRSLNSRLKTLGLQPLERATDENALAFRNKNL